MQSANTALLCVLSVRLTIHKNSHHPRLHLHFYAYPLSPNPYPTLPFLIPNLIYSPLCSLLLTSTLYSAPKTPRYASPPFLYTPPLPISRRLLLDPRRTIQIALEFIPRLIMSRVHLILDRVLEIHLPTLHLFSRRA
jgi:hypothetical protein